MNRILSQSQKELAQFGRDRLTVALAFLLPLAILMIYGFAIRLEVKNIPLSVQDFDRSSLSRSYIERLYANQQFIPAPTPQGLATEPIDRNRSKATLIIPPDFSRQFQAGQTTAVQVLVDGTDVNNARVIQGSIRATTRFFIGTIRDLPPPVIQPEIRLWFNPGRQESLYIVPGIFGVILWVFPSMLAAIAVVREKEQGTILQIYASDLTAGEWLLGKGLAYLLVGLAEAFVVMGVSMLIFGIRLAGEPSALLVGTLIFLAAAVSFGLLVGSRGSNQNAVVQGTAILGFLTAFLLSGFIYRLENIPFPLSMVSKIIPARYYIIVTRDAFLRGTGWPGVWFVLLIIAALGTLMFLGAVRSLQAMQLND